MALVAVAIAAAAPICHAADNKTTARASWEAGIEAYNAKEYAEAVEAFETVVASDYASAEVYYNLANAYFKLGQQSASSRPFAGGELGRAVLNYERALKLDPTLDDARYNLDIAKDYTNDTGTTKCSKYWVMYPKLTETTTIKVIAVKVDGDAVYKSETAEATYVVSRTMPYIPAKKITADKRYALFAADSVANYFFAKDANGSLGTTGATIPNENYIETVECNGFIFTAVDGGYAIQNHDRRYISQSGNNFTFSDDMPGKDAVWNITFGSEGYATIKNSTGYTIYFSTEEQAFVCIKAGQATKSYILPKLYMQREYPTFTVTPAQGTTLERLSEIIVTCDEGIKASNLNVASEGAVTTFTVKQTNSNTLTLTAKKELTTTNNVNLNINFTGDILLNPNGMNMSIPIPTKYGKKTLVSYDLFDGYHP
mgnify:CR=1 FL=1